MIACGLAYIAVHVALPTAPIAAAFAVLALGASIVTVKQFGRPDIVTGHVVIYAGLYVLLVGAVYDNAARQSELGLSMAQTIDLGISAGIMAFVIRLCAAGLTDDHCGPVD